LAIELDQGCGLRMIDLEPILDRLWFIVVALSQFSPVLVAFPRHLGRVGEDIIDRTARIANKPRGEPFDQHLIAHANQQDRVDFFLSLCQRFAQGFRLCYRARKPIEHHALFAIGAGDAFHHHLDGYIVGHQLALVHIGLGKET